MKVTILTLQKCFFAKVFADAASWEVSGVAGGIKLSLLIYILSLSPLSAHHCIAREGQFAWNELASALSHTHPSVHTHTHTHTHTHRICDSLRDMHQALCFL